MRQRRHSWRRSPSHLALMSVISDISNVVRNGNSDRHANWNSFIRATEVQLISAPQGVPVLRRYAISLRILISKSPRLDCENQ